jgi:regulator of sigma E protease
MSVVYFLVLVGVLVTIHELGHLIAAKLLDVRVLRFSIGFGRPLVRLRGRETDYQLALIPLGGYVRLLGEDPADVVGADAHRAWNARPVWQRTLVVLAGPVANLALPIVLYFAAFAGHHELTSSIVGDVVPGSPAALAGLVAGDRVTAVDGDEIRYWEDLERAIERRPAVALPVAIERRGKPLDLTLTPSRDADGRAAVGVVAAPFLPQIAVLDAASPAGRAGLATGDRIAAIDGAPIRRWSELEAALRGPARRLGLGVLRGERFAALGVQRFAPHHATLSLDVARDGAGDRRSAHGVHPAAAVLAEVEPGGPAALAGLRVGDRITAVDGVRLDHWLPMSRAIAAHGTAPVALDYLRGGPGGVTAGRAIVRQRLREGVDDYGQRSSALELGARPRFVAGRVETVAIEGRLFYAAGKAVERTFETISAVASGMTTLVRGDDPEDELGGPITMFRAAAVSASKGLEAFLLMLALVSVSVGLLNLLPIPTLDGGQLVLFAIESLRRRPLSLRTQDRVAWIGLAAVGLITILAIGSDVMRYVL